MEKDGPGPRLKYLIYTIPCTKSIKLIEDHLDELLNNFLNQVYVYFENISMRFTGHNLIDEIMKTVVKAYRVVID